MNPETHTESKQEEQSFAGWLYDTERDAPKLTKHSYNVEDAMRQAVASEAAKWQREQS